MANVDLDIMMAYNKTHVGFYFIFYFSFYFVPTHGYLDEFEFESWTSNVIPFP